MDDGRIEIRSYRVVFQLERRIHRIDRYRIPLPYGLPLRSVAYAAAALGLVLVLSRLPGTGAMLAALPVPMRFLVIPAVAGFALTRVRVDGRTAHAVARSLLGYVISPRRIASWSRTRDRRTVRLANVRCAPDVTGGRARAGTVHGPARLLVRHPFEARQRGRALSIKVTSAAPMFEGKRIALTAGQRAVIRCAHR